MHDFCIIVSSARSAPPPSVAQMWIAFKILCKSKNFLRRGGRRREDKFSESHRLSCSIPPSTSRIRVGMEIIIDRAWKRPLSYLAWWNKIPPHTCVRMWLMKFTVVDSPLFSGFVINPIWVGSSINRAKVERVICQGIRKNQFPGKAARTRALSLLRGKGWELRRHYQHAPTPLCAY